MMFKTSPKQLIDKVAHPGKLRKRYIALICIVFIALCASLVYLYINSQKPQDWRKRTAQVERGSIDVRIIATGTVRPINEIKVSPKSTGLIKQLYVAQGDVVKKGQILAQMDDSNLRPQLESAEGAYLMARDNYLKLSNGNRPQEVAIAKLQERRALDIVRQAEHNIVRLRSQVESMTQQSIRDDAMAERQTYLDDQGAISDQDKLNAETQSKMTHAQLDAARRELAQAEATLAQNTAEHSAAREQADLSKIGFRDEDIASAKHAVLQAKGTLDTLQSNINDMTIRAPFAGVITQKYADAGAIVTPTTSAATTSATSSSIVALAGNLEMVAEVAETDIGKIGIGQPVEIISNAYPERVFHGHVTQIAPEAVVTQNVTTFEVHTSIDDGNTGGTAADSSGEQRHHRRHHDQDGQAPNAAKPSAMGGNGDRPSGRNVSREGQHIAKLLSGMNVSARFVAGKLDNTLLVPTVCIMSRHGKTGVLLAQPDGTPKFQPVKTGPTVDTKTAITSGVNDGDLVFLGLSKEQLDQQGYSSGGRNGREGRGGGSGGGQNGPPIPRTFAR